jgi:malate dehydrogenase (oxaloacetate-decarboxylating)(NADP+)
MREVLQIIRARAPELNIDGEMHGDVALDAELRKALMPRSTLQGDANLLVLPSMESANISYNLLKRAAGNNVAIGPMLMGCAAPVHVLTASATVRRLVNMTAIAVVQANSSSSTGLNRPTRA